jgi:serine/threonine-protein kinase
MEPAVPDAGLQGETEQEVIASRVGEVLGDKYELTRKIGEGGMGEVYEAKHLVLGRRCAIKLLHPELTRSHRMLHRFSREALEASRLDSDHVVSVFDCGHTSVGTPYYVMELLRGEDLRHVLKRDGTLAVSRAVRIGVDVCRGLHVAHDRSLVHRDLKPENVFVVVRDDGREVAKILDFGVVLVTGSAPTTQAGTLVGTIRYMSPEQVRGDAGVDARADIYALGVILYECLVGEVPYAGRNAEELLFHVMNDAPRPVRELRAEIPLGLERVIERALDRDPRRRHQSAVELAEALIPFGAKDLASLRARYEIRAPALAASEADPRVTSEDTIDEDLAVSHAAPARRARLSARMMAFGVALAVLVGGAVGFYGGARRTERVSHAAPSAEPDRSPVLPAPPPSPAQAVVVAAPSEAPAPETPNSATGSQARTGGKPPARSAHAPAWFDSQNPYEATPRAR